jgi:hypothetical protein
MRKLSLVLALAAVCVPAAGAWAQDKKEATLKGTILCARCALKEGKKCQTAIRVREKNKTVTYYLLDKGIKETYHEEVCGGDKREGAVTGTVSEKGGKKYIAPKKVEYAKR